MTPRRFPPPWSVDDPDMKQGQECFIVRDGNGQALAYIYFEDEPGQDGGGVPLVVVSTVRSECRKGS
jgi:hypothetical protein